MAVGIRVLAWVVIDKGHVVSKQQGWGMMMLMLMLLCKHTTNCRQDVKSANKEAKYCPSKRW